MKATLKELSFQAGGHILHTLFWQNLAPAAKAGKEPGGTLAEALKNEFGSFERFKKEFSSAAASTEGSGWAALARCGLTGRPMIMQIEKHNVNVYPYASHPDGPGRLGACLLSGLQEREAQVRGGLLEHSELG